MLEFCKIAVHFFGCALIGTNSCFFGFEQTEVVSFSFKIYHCSPACAVFSLVDALGFSFIIFVIAMVMQILPVSSFTQIFPAVVAAIFVFMIYLFFRPLTSFHEKYKTVRKIHFTCNSYNNVAVRCFASCWAAFFTSWASVYFPRKNSCIWIIVQNRFDKLWGYFLHGKISAISEGFI